MFFKKKKQKEKDVRPPRKIKQKRKDRTKTRKKTEYGSTLGLD